MKRLLDDRYLFQCNIASDKDKLHYFQSFKVTDLKQACKKVGVKTGKSKQETIDRMIESKKTFNLPIAVIPAPAFIEWFNGLVDFYISEIRRNADRFHPLYHEEIWDNASGQTYILAVENAIDAIKQSPYWLKRLTVYPCHAFSLFWPL